MDRGGDAAPRIVQAEQSIQLDLMFLRNSSLVFLIAVILPLGLVLVMQVEYRTSECVLDAINAIISVLASKHFDAVSLRCDGEKAIEETSLRHLRPRSALPKHRTSDQSREEQSARIRRTALQLGGVHRKNERC